MSPVLSMLLVQQVRVSPPPTFTSALGRPPSGCPISLDPDLDLGSQIAVHVANRRFFARNALSCFRRWVPGSLSATYWHFFDLDSAPKEVSEQRVRAVVQPECKDMSFFNLAQITRITPSCGRSRPPGPWGRDSGGGPELPGGTLPRPVLPPAQSLRGFATPNAA